jgi:hypothetical protein
MAFIDQSRSGYDMTDPVQVRQWERSNHPDEAVYGSNEYYPDPFVQYHERSFRGYRIVDLIFTPFRYRPAMNELAWCRQLEFEFVLRPTREAPAYRRDVSADRDIVRAMVVNPDLLDTTYPNQPARASRSGPTTNYYVIITSTNLAASFEGLRTFHSYDVDHQASIVTLDTIRDFYSYTNVSDVLKIGWYVQNELYSNGTEYVLIGGDVNVVTSHYGSSDFYFSMGQIPVGRFSAATPLEVSNCVAKVVVPVSNGTDRVQFVPRRDEVGPGLITYTNIFVPYLEVDVDMDLYSAPPNDLFPAMDSHTIMWARGHGYYLYPQWAPSWRTPDNVNCQPVCVNFGCSGAVIDYDDHPSEAYQYCRYGNAAYMGTVADTTYHSFGVSFFESYLVDGTASPAIGDMMLIAWNRNSLFTLLGDPRYEFVSEQFQAMPRVSAPGYGGYSRSYNTDSGTGYIDQITFSVKSFNDCGWALQNFQYDSPMSNHVAFSCLGSNVSTDVTVQFLDVTNIPPGSYNVRWDVCDTNNGYFICSKTIRLTVTDKNILTDDDFIVSGNTNRLPAGT